MAIDPKNALNKNAPANKPADNKPAQNPANKPVDNKANPANNKKK